MDIKMISAVAKTMRRRIFDVSYSCNTSVHLGGALSIVDILATLYCDVLRLDPKIPELPERDRFILSKGHGALGYYAALLVSGFISEETFNSFQMNGSDLTTHPVMKPSFGIESSNGSLGQGLSMGVGMAIAAKTREQSHKIYVLLGDGECNEGSVWEAIMSAANFKLDNLIAIVDKNDFQNDGTASSVMEPGDFVKKWDSFGWNAILVDGHNIEQIHNALTARSVYEKPKVLIAQTVKGRGSSVMEHKAEWHHNRLTKSQYELTIQELEST